MKRIINLQYPKTEILSGNQKPCASALFHFQRAVVKHIDIITFFDIFQLKEENWISFTALNEVAYG